MRVLVAFVVLVVIPRVSAVGAGLGFLSAHNINATCSGSTLCHSESDFECFNLQITVVHMALSFEALSSRVVPQCSGTCVGSPHPGSPPGPSHQGGAGESAAAVRRGARLAMAPRTGTGVRTRVHTSAPAHVRTYLGAGLIFC